MFCSSSFYQFDMSVGLLDRPDTTGVDIDWENVVYSITNTSLFSQKAEEKHILKNLSGQAKGGRLLGIMGPSGCGKTSLLNFLCGRLPKHKSHKLEGTVTFNGVSLSRSVLTGLLSFVAQDDIVFEMETPREAFYFNGRIRRNLSDECAKKSAESLLEELGLKKCADTIIGKHDSMQGISGGERKRTNIGVELITQPRILLLDEPTTGLDSASALRIVHMLKDLAHVHGNTVVCTIHQPSSEIFHVFDDLMLLSRGECIYHGETRDSVPYFNSLGFPIPNHCNPAEHFLSVIHRNRNIQKFARLKGPQTLKQVSRNWDTPPRAPLFTQVKLLAARSFRDMFRSPVAFYARAFQTIVFILLLGLLYLKLTSDQEGVQDRVGLLFFTVVNQAMVSLINGAIVFPPERAIFLREQANGAYNPYAYAFSKIFAELPLQVLFPSVFAACVYWVTGLRSDLTAFGIFLATCVLVANTAQSYGLFVTAAISSVQAAMSIVPITVMPFFLTGGLMANTERLTPWLGWLSYISFIRRGFIALMRNEFAGRENFSCPLDNGPCIFPTGDSVLRFYGFETETIGAQMVNLLTSMAVLRILTALSLAYHSRKSMPT